MKHTIMVEKEVYLKTLHVRAGVRYWEDSRVNGVEDTEGNLIPMRRGDHWCPVIYIENGKIQGWPQGTTASIHYKVCDDGTYEVLDADGNCPCTKQGYVPSCMCPTESGYGDYIIMDIMEDGTICNWNFDFKKFQEEGI